MRFWHDRIMYEGDATPIRRKLIDSLYVEAMLLADEARTYFDAMGRAHRDGLDAVSRVGFSCESLKVTTRLMHVIAWLLTHRAVETGEIAAATAMMPSRRLSDAPSTDSAALSIMPEEAQAIIRASMELYRRVARLDIAMADPEPLSPARTMQRRLSLAF